MNFSKKILFRFWIMLLSACLVLFVSCQPGLDRAKIAIDKIIAGDNRLKDLAIVNHDGWATIHYSLPKDGAASYVIAKYMIRSGSIRESRSGQKQNYVTLSGFSRQNDYNVELYAIDSSGTSSEPVSVRVHPGQPPYLATGASIRIRPDFGGLNIRALNKRGDAMTITLMCFDSLSNAMKVINRHYFRGDSVNYSVRSISPGRHRLAAYVTDSYGNSSPLVYCETAPVPEKLLDRNRFRLYKLASDSEIGFNWPLINLWDCHTDNSSDGWHTNMGIRMPALCSFDLGVTAKLFRVVIWERADQYAYTAGNPKAFSLWGSNKTNPKDHIIPLDAPVGAIAGDWINLGNFQYPLPPSGLKPPATDAGDSMFIKSGVSFNVPLHDRKVKFVRLAVKSNWSGQNYAHLMEMAFYGSYR